MSPCRAALSLSLSLFSLPLSALRAAPHRFCQSHAAVPASRPPLSQPGGPSQQRSLWTTSALRPPALSPCCSLAAVPRRVPCPSRRLPHVARRCAASCARWPPAWLGFVVLPTELRPPPVLRRRRRAGSLAAWRAGELVSAASSTLDSASRRRDERTTRRARTRPALRLLSVSVAAPLPRAHARAHAMHRPRPVPQQSVLLRQ
jgi:hypothetical protein